MLMNDKKIMIITKLTTSEICLFNSKSDSKIPTLEKFKQINNPDLILFTSREILSSNYT